MKIESQTEGYIKEFGVIAILLVLVFFSQYYNYLLFHTIAEVFSIFIAFGIFVVTWHTRKFKENNFFLFLGVIYLFVGAIDFLHTLSYPGMTIFDRLGTNLPTQLWIIARYFESLSLLAALVLFNKRINTSLLLLFFFTLCSLLLTSLFYWNIFPDCFIEGKGLTVFKKNSEYIISFTILITIGLLVKNSDKMKKETYYFLLISLSLKIISELSFTFYVSAYGLSNLVGHYFKILSFYFIYKGVIDFGLKEPFIELNELLAALKNSEAVLEKERDKLKEAISKIKTLSGLLPICANCKKIRDDKGYWNQIENYICDHSDAEFTHGICPTCKEELYGDILKSR